MVAAKVVIVVVVIVFFHTQSCHLGNDAILPGRNRLGIAGDVHPDGHRTLFTVGTGEEGTLESEVIMSRQWKGIPDRLERGWSTGLSRFGGQEDIGMQLFISIFGNEITAA